MRLTRHSRWQGVKRYAAVTLPVLFLAACATQEPTTSGTQNAASTGKPILAPKPAAPAVTPQQAELKSLVALQDRLYDVAAPLLVNNAVLCRNNARNLLGFTAKTKFSYTAEFIDAATSLGLTDQLQVTGVLTGSGAAKVGLQRGDLLVAIQDKPVPTGADAERQTALMLGPLVNGRSNIKVTIARNGSNQTLNVPLTRACAFGIELGNTDNVISYADGRRVLISAGMMKFVRSDDELAYVIAKEMAHNTLTHPARQRLTATLSGVIDNLVRLRPDNAPLSGAAGVKPYPQQLDAAADKLALYMVARAGYKVDDASAFWQRLATQYPATVLNGYTAIHPATTYRIAAIEQAVSDIQAKQASGSTVLP
ncbi:peptidase M48 family protein [Collimonas arenae]|uniref:Peptidase M48 family protein n=1 Tax=Collimonas arenae TaxID=279058 RepID=A0A127QFV4_9BURK|nr:M48 family metallopeptidase [Collimonas arenae]AMO99034.1 peptidase M48 family protein [Collimonas arenae]AMP08930.1 peptidase M48 family protein [Collimonas arenae]